MFETLGHYKILDRIGAGGMGEVYRARDTRLGRTVAIKVLPPSVAGDPDRRERFLREARAAAALSHPNIAALYEIGEDQGQLFLVFEFVPGETLRSAIGGRPLNPMHAVEFAIQIADALADAHAEGIVHRDIKPDTIIVTPKGRAKILDFGLATWTAGGAEREQVGEQATGVATGVGVTLGTIAYMSPEQALGERVDQRTDIFSLGIVLFEMLTGRPPFAGPTPTAISLQIVQATPPPPSTVNPAVPREIDPVVLKALGKSLDQRYESAATLAAELRSIAAMLEVRATAAEMRGEPVPGAPARPRRQIPWRSIFGVLLTALLAAGAWSARAAIARQWRRTVGPPPPPVIAVVPFETDPTQTFFADGLAEDLITRLGQTPGLKVIGRSATRSYRGRLPRDVARELNAAVVLTGSVRPASDSVKVSLELIDPADGTDLWTSQFTRDVKDIFAVQADVAEQVAQALRVKLQPTPASARAASRLVDPRAYEAYLRARDAMARRRMADAIPYFEQAIEADGGLAEAHAGLAEALVMQASLTDHAGPGLVERAKREVEAAFRTDPDLPEAHEAAALLESAGPNVAAALDHLRAAIQADPSNAAAYHFAGDVVLLVLPDRALDYYRESLALDPALEASRGAAARALLLLRRRDEAVAELHGRTDDPVGGALMIAEYDLLTTGRTTLAPRRAPTAGDYVPAWVRYARALKQVGRDAEASALLGDVLRVAPRRCDAAALAGGTRATASVSASCATVAAAVAGNARALAAAIDRIASGNMVSDDTEVAADLVRFDEMRRWYPWRRTADDPRVTAAVGRLGAAVARLKAELLPKLLPLPAVR